MPANCNPNRLFRPYDRAFTVEELARVRGRRQNPTGVAHSVSTFMRGNREVYRYPWDEMELGDFFLAPVIGSERAMRTAFYQAAARRDVEIAIKPVDKDGTKNLRVTLTVFGINGVKHQAAKQGVKGLRFSDGKWSNRRKVWRDERKGTSPAAKPVWASVGADPHATTPVSAPEPEIHLTRQQMIEKALAAGDRP